MEQKTIILLGMENVGKSTIGLKLAHKINYKWVDSDVYLHEVLKFPSKETYSNQEFSKKKELELEILEFVLERPNIVYSSPGGLIINQNDENLSKIKKLINKNLQHSILLYREEDDITPFEEFHKNKVLVDKKDSETIIDEIKKIIE